MSRSMRATVLLRAMNPRPRRARVPDGGVVGEGIASDRKPSASVPSSVQTRFTAVSCSATMSMLCLSMSLHSSITLVADAESMLQVATRIVSIRGAAPFFQLGSEDGTGGR